jgi:uncharacterized membrane protein YraQ (UPF0718 family)
MNKNFINPFKKSLVDFIKSLPLLLGTFLFISLFNSIVSKEFYLKVFNFNPFIDSVVGAVIGSLSFGTPITSYVIGGELLNNGVSLIAVTAFLVSWVTVGFLQFPAEEIMLGKRFAITRNVLSFVSSIIVALLTFLIWSIF